MYSASIPDDPRPRPISYLDTYPASLPSQANCALRPLPSVVRQRGTTLRRKCLCERVKRTWELLRSLLMIALGEVARTTMTCARGMFRAVDLSEQVVGRHCARAWGRMQTWVDGAAVGDPEIREMRQNEWMVELAMKLESPGRVGASD